ncbi:MAG: flagellar basal body L-ring protein FlgH [Burkholderiales bacterium]
MTTLFSALRAARILALAMAAMAACACAPLNDAMVRPTVDVREPTTVRPPVMLALAAPSSTAEPGAIFVAGSHRGLFEDRRARLVGDVLTIQIQEKYSAKQSSNSTVDRTGSVDASVGLLPFMTPNSTTRFKAQGSSSNSFEGKGATGTDNEFTGTITVTVVEVLANGNLAVVGEKQVGINQNVERLRFSGVVNPATILPGNLVTSTQVADARLEVRSRGDIDRAQTTGWLSRFFLSFVPI